MAVLGEFSMRMLVKLRVFFLSWITTDMLVV